MKTVTYGGKNIPGKLKAVLSRCAKEDLAAAKKYPLVTNGYWLGKLSGEPDDPFLLQMLPNRAELEAAIEGDCPDPFLETGEASPFPGVVRRFKDRILVFVTDACAMRCRHCTRKNLLAIHSPPDGERLSEIARYVLGNGEIREVLLSGGDPLMLRDDEIVPLTERFAVIPSVDAVRIGSRIPCTFPARVTKKLAGMLSRTKKVWLNTQFNHPGEITPEAERACALLVNNGIPVSCQTVLLKGINDNAQTLAELFRRLQRIRVRPYYAFAGDPVSGTAHFRVSREKARELECEVAQMVGGLALPRFVIDRPGAKRKEPV